MKEFLVILISLLVTVSGCDQKKGSTPSNSSKSSNPTVQAAREGLEAIKGMYPSAGMQWSKMQDTILYQPDFTGPLKEFGCMALMDESGNILKAHTLKIVDYPSGQKYSQREYTAQEIASSKEQIQSYWIKTDRGSFTVILSDSLRIATAYALLADDNSKKWQFRRSGETLEIIEVSATGTKVLAADAIYMKQYLSGGK